MSYTFQIMSQEQAEHIADKWKYEGEYAFYDMSADEEDLAEFLDDKKRGDSIYSVFQDGEMVGFFSFNALKNENVDIGLGMRPNITGKGKGKEFTEAGLDFARTKYSVKSFSLSVATFNRRAINVYKKVGFQAHETFLQQTNGSSYEFLKMKYSIENKG